MKSLRRYFCVLLSCALLLGAFSVTANAEEVETDPFHIFVESSTSIEGSSKSFTSFIIKTNDGTATFYTFDGIKYTPYYYYNGRFDASFTVAKTDKSILVEGGRQVTFSLDNCYIWTNYTSDYNGTTVTGKHGITDVTLVVEYEDGTSKFYEAEFVNHKGSPYGFDLKATITPDADIRKISFRTVVEIKKLFPTSVTISGTWGQPQFHIGEDIEGQNYHFTIDQSTEEAGLLSGILGWIENIWNTVTDGFTDMKNGITNIVNKITDLPRLLWEKIETGLKNLFVPDDEYIVGYKDRWDELLADRLGAVYEVVNVTFESWDKINVSDATNTVDMPKVTIPLLDDEEFSFGGFPVKIVPDGFEMLVTACKLIVGIVCTIMFVNGLRKRYDEVMGVEQ